MRTVLLALGNDLLGDDAVGFEAARLLKGESLPGVDVVESPHAPGSILEFGPADFKKLAAPSPHFAGLPEILAMAERLKLHMPKDLRVLAMEVDNPTFFSQTLTPAVRDALPAFVAKARAFLKGSA